MPEEEVGKPSALYFNEVKLSAWSKAAEYIQVGQLNPPQLELSRNIYQLTMSIDCMSVNILYCLYYTVLYCTLVSNGVVFLWLFSHVWCTLVQDWLVTGIKLKQENGRA